MDGIVNAITVAITPTTQIPMRITQMISISEARWRKINLYTLRANIEAADKTDESAEDITAADTAPNPKNETKSGVRYCRTMGRIMLVSASVNGYGPLYSVSFHAEQVKIQLLMDKELAKFLFLTSSLCNGTNHHGRNRHQQATKSSHV